MKVFGKKTLALTMAIAMILSLCSFNAFAATVKPTALEISGQNVMGVGETVELSVTAEPDGASTSVTWKSSSTKIATVSSDGKVTAKKAGTVTITAKSKSVKNVEAPFVIEVKPVTGVALDDFTVGVGTSKETVKDIIATKDATVYYDGGSYEGKAGVVEWKTSSYKANTKGDYTFEVSDDDVDGEVDVTVGLIELQDEADAELEPIYVPTGTKVSAVKLPTTVSLLLNTGTEKVELTVGSNTKNHFEKWECDEDLGTKFEEEDEYTYTAQPRDTERFEDYDLPTLTLKVIVYDNEVADVTLDAGTDHVYLDDAIPGITNALEDIFGSDAELDHIAITKITGYNEDKEKENDSYISGTLYTNSECENVVDEGDDAFTAEDFSELYFVANGKGNDTILEYTAYADEEGNKALKGRIIIQSDVFMTVEMEVANSDVLDFNSSDFSSAFKALDKDNTLDYVVFDNDLYSSEGELYYKYDTKNEEVVDDEEYFVKANSKDDELDLDDVTFVPDEDYAGVISIEFTAYGYDDDDDEIDADGVLHIVVLDQADIVIMAGVGEKVPVDVELFEEYLDDEADTDDIAYIVFDGAPYTTTDGYLVAGSKSFKTSGDKTFHMDPEKGEYDLEDLYFVGGSSTDTKRAEFEIYYFDDDDDVEDDPVTGTVDFTTGVSTNVYTKDPLKASEVLKFSSSIKAFENVGNQDNEYFKFTSLPKGGKLYYNFGTSSQEDVTIGTKYYLGTSASGKLLKNITFVPSYDSAKKQQVITFDYKAYDKDDNYVDGSCFFEVTYAAKSQYFSDITTGVYADSVDFLKNQGITTGVPGGIYDANGSLTRAQVVTFLYRAAGEPIVSGTTTFKDIGKGEYYYNAVLWASQTGVTAGRSATVFDPNATVTNAEVIQFMYNFDVKYLKHTSYTAGSIGTVTDYAKVDSWAQTAVKWAIGKGVLTPGYLYPTTVGTRGNIALYLHRMLTL